MPYAPGIQYRGDQFLAQGISSLGERVQKELDTKKMEKRLVESYKTQGQAMGLDPEVLDKHSSLGALAGFIEGTKMKKAQDYQAAQMEQMRIHGALYQQQIDANKAAMVDKTQQAAAMKGFSDYVGGEDAVPLQGPPNVQQEMVPPDPQEMQSRLDALVALSSTQMVPMDAGQMFDVAKQPSARLAPVPGGLGSVNVPRMERMTPADYMRAAARFNVPPTDQVQQAHAWEYLAKAAKEMNGSATGARHGEPVWSRIPGTRYMQGHVPGSGSMLTVPIMSEEDTPGPEVRMDESGRWFQKVVHPRTGEKEWKPLAMDRPVNPKQEIEADILRKWADDMDRRKGGTPPAPAAPAPSATRPAPTPRAAVSAEEKAARANELQRQNPGWTREQVKAAVVAWEFNR